MTEPYTIVDMFRADKKVVLILNHAIPLDEYRNEHVVIKGEVMPYMFTHNDYFITVEKDGDYIGRSLEFVK